MLRILFLGLALIATSPAHAMWGQSLFAQNPALPPPGSIACDVGIPFTGTVPRVATATGMTHCAYNVDWTTPTYANVNTWLDCAGASSPLWFKEAGTGTTCADISMIMDGSKQVVNLHYNAGTYATVITSYKPGGGAGTTFPMNSYREVVFKVPAASYAAAGQPSFIMANWSLGKCWLDTGNFNCASNVEMDNIELGCNGSGCSIPQSTGDSAWHDWNVGGSNPGNLVTNGGYLGDANYHSYGILSTIDGTAHFGMCSYQDGAAISNPGNNCDGIEFRSAVNAAWFTQRNYIIDTAGVQVSGGKPGYGSLDVYMASQTVWVPASCTTWQTTECTTGTYYEGTPP